MKNLILISLTVTYWFAAFAIVIVIKMFIGQQKELRAMRKKSYQIPDEADDILRIDYLAEREEMTTNL